MKTTITLICSLLIALSAVAQTGSVQGTVLDDKGLTAIGASVVVKGSTLGSTTGIDGTYRIDKVPVGKQTLVVSFIGYKKQEIAVEVKSGETATVDAKLAEDVLLLDQVVVVGYGTTQKRDVAGSIARVDGERIENSVQPSIDQALQGQATGVSVTSQNGIAGSAVKINVRGTNSIAAGSQPLVVVDGIPITTGNFDPGNLGSGSNALADINPNDIASMEILKDAAATAIYGSRGANGVILITTKRGKAGKGNINIGYSYGIVNETKRLEFLSAQEHLALRDRARTDLGQQPEAPGTIVGDGITRAKADSIAATGGTDWMDKFLRTGSQHEVNVNASGGNDQTTYYIGGTFLRQEGFLVGNTYNRANGRINLDSKVTKRLKVGGSMGLTYVHNDRVRTGDAGGLGWAQQKLPYVPIYNQAGDYYNVPGNPLWAINNQDFATRSIRTISSVYADHSIHKNITLHTDFGIDFLNQNEDEFNFRNTQDTNSRSSAWDRTTRVVNWTNNNYITWEKSFEKPHYLKLMVGQATQRTTAEGFGLYGFDFPNDYLTSPSDAPVENQSGYSYWTGNGLSSVFARINYKLHNRYLLNVSLRGDGSSRFGPGNKWGFFPAGAVGWVVSDEKWLRESKALSYLKLSVSYGLSGNDQIPDFAHRSLFTTGYGYAGNTGLAPTQLANPELRWEKSEQLDVNLDFAFVNNRIFGTVTYYRKTSSDLLMFVSLPTSSGYSGVWQNVGELENWGVEFTLTSRNIDKKFRWTTDLNLAMNRNKVLSAAGLPPDAFESGQPGEGRVIEGYPVGQAYLVEWAGVQQQDGFIGKYDLNGNPVLDANGQQQQIAVSGGTELFYDRNGNLMTYANPTGGLFYEYHRKPMGNPLPIFYGGITNTLSFAGVELNFLFSFAYGNTIYDDAAKSQIGSWQSIAQRREILDAWSPSNTDTDVPKLNGYVAVNSSRWLYDGSYLRLRSLTLAYNFPKKLLERAKIGSLRIYATGGNLWTLTAFPGWDPEVMRNVDPNSQAGNVSFAGPYLGTPQARTITFGFQLGI